MKFAVFAMSKSRPEVRASLEQNSRECMLHIAKLWLFPSALDVGHWRKKVSNFYQDVDTLKPKGKLPSSDFIFDSIWETKTKVRDNLFEIAADREPDLTPDPSRLADRDGFYTRMRDYIRWVSDKLSTDGYTLRSECVAELESLGL